MTGARWPAGLSQPGDEKALAAPPLPRPATLPATRGIGPHAAARGPGRAQEAPEPGSYRPSAAADDLDCDPLEPGQARELDRAAARAATANPEPQRLATFSRGEAEELRVELAEYEGRPFVSLRLWFRGTTGAWHPTRKGVSLRLRELPELVRALGDAGVLLAGGRRVAKPRGEP